MLLSLTKKTTSNETEKKITSKAGRKMPDEERKAQVASFINANTKLDQTATQESIDRALKSVT